MIVPNDVRRLFEEAAPYVLELSKRVKETVFSYCMNHGFAFSARSKSIESVAEKIETGRFKRWDEIDDLFACTVVIPTLREELMVLDFLKRVFDTIRVRGRNDSRKAPDVFRFESTRYIGRLRSPEPALSRERLFLIPFEVQIRSAFEHAWSTTTHALVYKSTSVDWKRERLAAQLKAAVEQLDSLILMFEETVEGIVPRDWPDITARRLIAEYYTEQIGSGRIPKEIAPKDLSRFAENLWGLLRAQYRARDDEIEQYANQAINVLRSEIEATPGELIPRSISLFQYSLGILAKGHIIGDKLHRFYPLLTPELIALYPEVDRIRDRFEL